VEYSSKDIEKAKELKKYLEHTWCEHTEEEYAKSPDKQVMRILDSDSNMIETNYWRETAEAMTERLKSVIRVHTGREILTTMRDKKMAEKFGTKLSKLNNKMEETLLQVDFRDLVEVLSDIPQ